MLTGDKRFETPRASNKQFENEQIWMILLV